MQADGGSYSCKVTYIRQGNVFLGGEEMSNSARLTVVGVKSIEVSPHTLAQGRSATITCKAHKSGSAAFVWYKNGIQIKEVSGTTNSNNEVSYRCLFARAADSF